MIRKKVEPIIGLGDEDKITVQKSLPLLSLCRSSLTLAELKILDTYLARIDSHAPTKRTVIFLKGELEKLFGVKRIRTEELDKRLENLGSPVLLQAIDNDTEKFVRISLFDMSVAERDKDGEWRVELTASESAMMYFFNIENIHYFRYKLRYITALKSRYTYNMFMYLEMNHYKRFKRRSWEESLEKLQIFLGCEKEETYQEYRRFNDLILKKVWSEIHEKTEYRYTYEPIKKGRSVVAVRFTVDKSPKVSQEEMDLNQVTIDERQGEYREGELWENAVIELGFSPEQIKSLREVLVCVPSNRLKGNGICDGDVHRLRYHYMMRIVTDIQERCNNQTQQPIKDVYRYIKHIIEKDADD